MDFITFLDKNAAAIIAVFGTLAGGVVSYLFTCLLKKQEFNNTVKLRKIDLGVEFKKQNLIEPILLFL